MLHMCILVIHFFSVDIYKSSLLYVLSRSVMSNSCDPIDCSLPGSSAHGILQARILESLPFPPRDLPDPGIEPGSPALQPDSLATELQGKPHPEAKYKKFLLVIVRSVMYKLFSLVSNKEQKVDER